MVSPTNRQNGKLFVRQGASTGVIATLTMDCLSAVVHRLGLAAPLTPNLIGALVCLDPAVVTVPLEHRTIPGSQERNGDRSCRALCHWR
jgi:hypothetical protein